LSRLYLRKGVVYVEMPPTLIRKTTNRRFPLHYFAIFVWIEPRDDFTTDGNGENHVGSYQ